MRLSLGCAIALLATVVCSTAPPVQAAATPQSKKITLPVDEWADGAATGAPPVARAATLPELRVILSHRPEAIAIGIVVAFLLLVTGALLLARRAHQTDGPSLTPGSRPGHDHPRRMVAVGPAADERADPASDHERIVRASSRQLAYLGHELRMPVTAVVGMADILSRAELAPEHRRCVETILKSCDALTTVVDSFLDFSRIQSGSLALDSVDFDLQELVDEVLDMMSNPATAKGLELAALVESDVPPLLRGDPTRLRQVLVNLLGNAVKFTQEGHVFLRVSCRRPRSRKPELRFDVCDTGCGVARSQKECIFDAFVRADAPSGDLRSGVGLGLYIARSLVEQMDGQIGLDGATGLGSTFWFTARLEKQASDRNATRASDDDLLDAAALILDGSLLTRRVLTRYAQDLGLRAVAASDADTALEAMREAVTNRAPYELLFLDARMPGYDIMRITEAIREDERIPMPELVLLTTLGEDPDPLITALVGRHAELAKPLTRSRFSETVRDLMASRQPESGDLLPQAVSRPQGKALVPRAPNANGSRPLRILVAEDNPVVLEAVSDMLRDAGCRVDTAADGHVAIRAARENDYDAIFMDFQMPGLDGCEATRAIRRTNGNARLTPIIGLTAQVPDDIRDRCRRAGMVDYLVKPVRAQQLMAVLAQHCRPNPAPVERDAGAAVPAVRNPAAVDRLRRLFLEDSRARLRGLREAADDGDLDTVRREAHALIGSAHMVGAAQFGGACRALESAARVHGEAGETLPALREVEAAFEQVRTRFAKDDCAPAGCGPIIDVLM